MLGTMTKKLPLIIIFLYAMGVLVFFLIAYTPFYLPCLWKTVTGIPCPTCGLTRSFLYAYRLNIVRAIQMNILTVPIIFGMAAHLTCAFIDLIKGNKMLDKFHSFFAKSWVLVTLLVLLAISWVYNICANFI